MRTEEAVTGAGGIWFTLGAVLVPRAMARRWREAGSAAEEGGGPL